MVALDTLRRNLDAVRRRIEVARTRSARSAESVGLVAVIKSVPSSLFPLLAEAGVRDVGENRVQAALARRRESPPGWTWHGIGHLQRNKVAEAVGCFEVFHALDSPRLLERLEVVLEGTGRGWPVYVQVNAAGDPHKGGFAPGEVPSFVRRLAASSRLRCLGFMTMAREGAGETECRETFRRLREVRDEVVADWRDAEPPSGLSMGMSSDFEWAVEEGATVVRVGRALFEGVATEGLTAGGRR
jgi:hypothetical protein